MSKNSPADEMQNADKIKKGNTRTITIYQLVFTAMMAAVVFATTAILQIPIMLPTGKTMVSLANTMCILSGLLLGPVYGGLAAGIGSFLYDLTDPNFIAGAPITFSFKFIMGFVCGIVAYVGNKGFINMQRRVLSAVAGTVSYMLLYLGKSYITLLLAGSVPGAAFMAIIPKIAASSTNAILAVVIAVPLSAAIQKALARTNLGNKFTK